MFIAVLFTIAKVWKQPKCPSTDEWIMQRVGHERMTEHMHTPTFHIMEYLLLPSSHYVVSDSFANPSLSGFSVPGKNTGVGCHFLPPGDLLFSTQGSNLCLLLGRQILYQGICHLRSPMEY